MVLCNHTISQPTIQPRDPLESLFRKHAGEDGKMDYRELMQFLREASLTGKQVTGPFFN